MQRNVSTTGRVKLHSLINRKADLLVREYEAFQQFRGGAPGLKERGLPTSRKREASRPGRKPTLHDTNHGTVAARLPGDYVPSI
ncbi:hypothetical protein GWG54_16605 [Natronococcus sp. JC468]|uniref:hypothetical protein n=1 Tax=Natronococcus sp. JC468 TaxID=1961921 RepID=UPI00143B92EC|nr:hypothetical protein [Natronococcus sp. JC468]NKE37403.1 hypothetical protein [Natronococcus sp. JC468]